MPRSKTSILHRAEHRPSTGSQVPRWITCRLHRSIYPEKKAVLLTMVHTSQKETLGENTDLFARASGAFYFSPQHPIRHWVGPFSFKAPVLVPNLPLPLPTPGISTQSPMPQRRLVHGEWDPARGRADPETPGIPCSMPAQHPWYRSQVVRHGGRNSWKS